MNDLTFRVDVSASPEYYWWCNVTQAGAGFSASDNVYTVGNNTFTVQKWIHDNPSQGAEIVTMVAGVGAISGNEEAHTVAGATASIKVKIYKTAQYGSITGSITHAGPWYVGDRLLQSNNVDGSVVVVSEIDRSNIPTKFKILKYGSIGIATGNYRCIRLSANAMLRYEDKTNQFLANDLVPTFRTGSINGTAVNEEPVQFLGAPINFYNFQCRQSSPPVTTSLTPANRFSDSSVLYGGFTVGDNLTYTPMFEYTEKIGDGSGSTFLPLPPWATSVLGKAGSDPNTEQLPAGTDFVYRSRCYPRKTSVSALFFNIDSVSSNNCTSSSILGSKTSDELYQSNTFARIPCKDDYLADITYEPQSISTFSTLNQRDLQDLAMSITDSAGRNLADYTIAPQLDQVDIDMTMKMNKVSQDIHVQSTRNHGMTLPNVIPGLLHN